MRPDHSSHSNQITHHPMLRSAICIALTLVLWCFSHGAAAADEAATAWPDTVVKLEELRSLTVFRLDVPGVVSKGRVVGPAVLKAHITREGTVARVVLIESCGNPDLDESSIHALRAMRFKPYTFGGAPTEVTLALPVHVPANWGRSK
ncbi:MAG: hypothetical protein C0423_05000 [Methylibium sp.]|nr:hypothetical protein [Methylibium sp.]